MDDPLAPHSEKVAPEMRDCHPRAEDIARRKLLPIAQGSSASLLTVVQEALLSFAPDPAAGPSSLHPQLFKGGVLPGCRDEVMRSLHAVVRILGPIVSIASASLTALKKKDGGTGGWS